MDTVQLPQAAARLCIRQRDPEKKFVRLTACDVVIELNGKELTTVHSIKFELDARGVAKATVELYVDEVEIEGEGILTTFVKVPEPEPEPEYVPGPPPLADFFAAIENRIAKAT